MGSIAPDPQPPSSSSSQSSQIPPQQQNQQPPYTMAGILHHLQYEWHKVEVERQEWNNTQATDNYPCYHTLRYDFKPASINSEEPATLELTPNGQVTIKAPNVRGSISNQTVFKGQKRPHVKECLLVIDNSTGEMVLQKLTDNITVKATRNLGGGGTTTTTTTASGSTASGNGCVGTFAISSVVSGNGISNSNNTTSNNIGTNSVLTSSVSSSGSNNSTSNNTSNHINSVLPTTKSKNDGPELSEASSSSSDSSSSSRSRSSSSSSSSLSSLSSSSNSGNSSLNNEGFTF